IGTGYLQLYFFFQAEDGIRDLIVTGVQTCALPIPLAFSHSCRNGRRPTGASPPTPWSSSTRGGTSAGKSRTATSIATKAAPCTRSEERRVGKEGAAHSGSEWLTNNTVSSISQE